MGPAQWAHPSLKEIKLSDEPEVKPVEPTPAAPEPSALEAAKPQISQEVEWGDKSIALSDLTFFKGEIGAKKRIFIMTQKPKMMRVHYKEGYFRCLSEYETKDGMTVQTVQGKCCEMLTDPPSMRFAVVVCLYDTKKDGALKCKDMKHPSDLDFEFQIWILSEATFARLRTKHEEWDLTQHDLLISCTEEKYQRIDVDVCKDALVRYEEMTARVMGAFNIFKHKDPSKFLAKPLSESEIVVRLGGETQVAPPEIASKDFDDLLKGLK